MLSVAHKGDDCLGRVLWEVVNSGPESVKRQESPLQTVFACPRIDATLLYATRDNSLPACAQQCSYYSLATLGMLVPQQLELELKLT